MEMNRHTMDTISPIRAFIGEYTHVPMSFIISCNVKNIKDATPDPSNPNSAPAFRIFIGELKMKQNPPRTKNGPHIEARSPNMLGFSRSSDRIHRPNDMNRSM